MYKIVIKGLSPFGNWHIQTTYTKCSVFVIVNCVLNVYGYVTKIQKVCTNCRPFSKYIIVIHKLNIPPNNHINTQPLMFV